MICLPVLSGAIGTHAANFEGIEQFNVERDLLFNVLTECRVVSCGIASPVKC